MAKIDIGSQKTSTSTGQSLILWAVVLCLFWFVFIRSGPESLPKPPKPSTWPDAVVLVPPVGIAGSTKLDEWGAANKQVSLHLHSGADLSNAEPWVQELYKLSDGQQPCAIVSIGDDVEIIPIQDDLLEELESLR